LHLAKQFRQGKLAALGAFAIMAGCPAMDAIKVHAFNDLFKLVHDADPRHKAELYNRIGLRLTHRPGPETVIAEAVKFSSL
jgi:hypothetical protein